LSKGKKRCPVCRNFFVPGTRIDDKEVIVNDEPDASDEDSDASGGINESTHDQAAGVIERVRIERHAHSLSWHEETRTAEMDIVFGPPSSRSAPSSVHL
jgi:hypothetical protein